MDPKVCGKLLTHHRRGYGVDVEALHDRFPLWRSSGKGPKMDILGTEGCAVEIRFYGAPGCFWSIWIYIGGRSRSVEPRGAHEGEDAPPASWTPLSFLHIHSKSSGSRSFRKSRSQRFHSVWTPFDIPFLWNPKIVKKTSILGWASG